MFYTVRFLQPYKIVLAIVLPCLAIVPFIYFMNAFMQGLSDWTAYVIIFAFLGLIAAYVLHLVFTISPRVQVSVEGTVLKFNFPKRGLLTPLSFQLDVAHIHDLTPIEYNDGTQYIRIKAKTYPYFFSLAACTYNEKDIESYDSLIRVINQQLQKKRSQKST